ncbi:methyltransferase domain-containing protein [Streptomyces sp. RS10V-4]|uniref:methyltransferase domain-containing protein n=1 Tax=Streptomyces rhizoryzae TaxID=2932493 RepID=UPI002005EDCF|nr:methyltransferase domain-containing protein [Streptomyces rhizoryzae]MCK7624439.1 methyltransferase domain-containing protein [Streptomyces rhizoryzae]
MEDLSVLQDELARAMAELGLWPADSPWVRRAAETHPRHRFAPTRLWSWNGRDEYVAFDRGADPEAWARLLYAGPYESTVTQVIDGMPTSSLSCESIVADMLDALDLEPGHTTLELGTATGRNARLLAERAGPGRVVSVEYDPHLAEAAVTNLTATGGGVEVRVGDGAVGAPDRGPYDRIISTYAVETVPWAWVEQTRPGGRIVTPWGRLGHVALTVAPDGRSASGWIQGLAMFMPARGTQSRTWEQVHDEHPVTAQTRVDLDVAALHEDANGLFALRVIRPDIEVRTAATEGGLAAWAHDGRSSWARIATEGGPATAWQGGPRRLADELAAGRQEWQAAGAPALWDIGMTRTPDAQYLWAYDPETGPRWGHREVPAGERAA